MIITWPYQNVYVVTRVFSPLQSDLIFSPVGFSVKVVFITFLSVMPKNLMILTIVHFKFSQTIPRHKIVLIAKLFLKQIS
jgi:hypothetical protein